MRDFAFGSGGRGAVSVRPQQPPPVAPATPVRAVGEEVLERHMPRDLAPQPPQEANPFRDAIDGYARLQHENTVLTNETIRKDKMLIEAQREIDALTARLVNEVGFYKEQAEQARFSRDTYQRVAVKLATVNKSIGEAAAMLVNLTLESQQIVRDVSSYTTTPEPNGDIVEGMTATIEETLRNAGVRQEDRTTPRLPPNNI